MGRPQLLLLALLSTGSWAVSTTRATSVIKFETPTGFPSGFPTDFPSGLPSGCPGFPGGHHTPGSGHHTPGSGHHTPGGGHHTPPSGHPTGFPSGVPTPGAGGHHHHWPPHCGTPPAGWPSGTPPAGRPTGKPGAGQSGFETRTTKRAVPSGEADN